MKEKIERMRAEASAAYTQAREDLQAHRPECRLSNERCYCDTMLDTLNERGGYLKALRDVLKQWE